VNHLGGAPVPSAAHLRSLMAPRVPSATRAASLATVDLRAKLESHHSGEDYCITIERQWERHRNLDRDFSAADTTPVRQAIRPLHHWDLGVAAWRLPHTSAW
jgi:hypothetical protein